MKFEELPLRIPIGESDDLTGQKFGKLTALFRVSTDKKTRKSFWACYCECGEYCVKRSDALKNGTSTFCEIHNHNNLVGNKYGHLLVIKRMDEYDKIKRWKYMCLCDCGNPEPIYTWQRYLTNGDVVTCGCNNKFSLGEIHIIDILDKNNINYCFNKKFSDCRFPISNSLAKFDFYIENSFVLEFDGEQHQGMLKSIWGNKDYYTNLHNHDLYKNQWAWENNIPMKRIPYTERDNLSLERIMSDEFLITPQTHPWWYPPKDSSYPYFTLEDIDKLKEVS